MFVASCIFLGLLGFAFAMLVPLKYDVYPENKRPWRGAYALAIVNAALPTFFAAMWLPFTGPSLEMIAAMFPVAGLYVLSGRYAQMASQLKDESQVNFNIDQPVSDR